MVDESRNAEALGDQLIELAEEHYRRKREELGEEAAGSMERIVLLRVIDSLWVEHLTEVDDMRKSIGLRAYSQRDPLNEFKVEAFRMFDGLKTTDPPRRGPGHLPRDRHARSRRSAPPA